MGRGGGRKPSGKAGFPRGLFFSRRRPMSNCKSPRASGVPVGGRGSSRKRDGKRGPPRELGKKGIRGFSEKRGHKRTCQEETREGGGGFSAAWVGRERGVGNGGPDKKDITCAEKGAFQGNFPFKGTKGRGKKSRKTTFARNVRGRGKDSPREFRSEEKEEVSGCGSVAFAKKRRRK